VLTGLYTTFCESSVTTLSLLTMRVHVLTDDHNSSLFIDDSDSLIPPKVAATVGLCFNVQPQVTLCGLEIPLSSKLFETSSFPALETLISGRPQLHRRSGPSVSCKGKPSADLPVREKCPNVKERQSRTWPQMAVIHIPPLCYEDKLLFFKAIHSKCCC
jgi:hypothetical protein